MAFTYQVFVDGVLRLAATLQNRMLRQQSRRILRNGGLEDVYDALCDTRLIYLLFKRFRAFSSKNLPLLHITNLKMLSSCAGACWE